MPPARLGCGRWSPVRARLIVRPAGKHPPRACGGLRRPLGLASAAALSVAASSRASCACGACVSTVSRTVLKSSTGGVEASAGVAGLWDLHAVGGLRCGVVPAWFRTVVKYSTGGWRHRQALLGRYIGQSSSLPMSSHGLQINSSVEAVVFFANELP